MKYLIVLVALLLAGCGTGNPLSATPTAPTSLTVPIELQPVIAALDADPWIHPLLGEPMGIWVRRYIHTIRFDDTVTPPNAAHVYLAQRTIGWQAYDPVDLTDMPLSVAMVLHEARHVEGYPHTCGNFDRTMEEGGAYAVQILYLEHAGYQPAASALRASSICQ